VRPDAGGMAQWFLMDGDVSVGFVVRTPKWWMCNQCGRHQYSYVCICGSKSHLVVVHWYRQMGISMGLCRPQDARLTLEK